MSRSKAALLAAYGMLAATAQQEQKDFLEFTNPYKARKDAEAKVLAEQKAKALAEKKAQLAPDKEKLLSFAAALKSVQLPEVKSAEASSILSSAVMLIGKIDKYITENANNL